MRFSPGARVSDQRRRPLESGLPLGEIRIRSMAMSLFWDTGTRSARSSLEGVSARFSTVTT